MKKIKSLLIIILCIVLSGSSTLPISAMGLDDINEYVQEEDLYSDITDSQEIQDTEDDTAEDNTTEETIEIDTDQDSEDSTEDSAVEEAAVDTFASPLPRAVSTKPNLTITPKYTTASLDKKVSFDLNGYDFTNPDKGVGSIYTTHWLDGSIYNSSAKFDKITFPRFDGTSMNGTPGISVRIMAFASGNYTLVKQVTFYENDGQTGFELTRQELLDYMEASGYEAGVMPGSIYIHIISGNSPSFNNITELKQGGPITFQFDVQDGADLYQATDSYQRYYNEFYYYEGTFGSGHVETSDSLNAFAYFNTTKIQISASKTTDLVPGEEVDLTFTLENESSYHNQYVYVGFKSENLTLTDGSVNAADINIPFASWNNSGNLYYSALKDTNGWITIQPNQTITFTQKVAIDSSFTGTSIDINPFRDHNYNTTSDYGDTITLWMQSPSPSASYYVKYNPNSGTGTEYSTSENVGSAHTILGNSNVNLGFSRSNYTFLGWSTNPNASSADFTGLGTETIGSDAVNDQTITLYAIWKYNGGGGGTTSTYSVKYDPNSGTGNSYSISTPVGSTHTVLANSSVNLGYTKTGYTFLGWSTNSNASKAEYTDSGNETVGSGVSSGNTITLYAVWSITSPTIETYTVQYLPSQGSGTIYTITETVGTAHTVLDNSEPNLGFTRKGYTLIGWNTYPHSSTAHYKSLALTTIGSDASPKEVITLYAVWKKDNIDMPTVNNSNINTNVGKNTSDKNTSKNYISFNKNKSSVRTPGTSDNQMIGYWTILWVGTLTAAFLLITKYKKEANE